MQARRHSKIIENDACQKSNDEQPHPGNRKRQPKYKKEVYIWSDKPVQVRDLIQNINLYQYEYCKPDDISQEIVHLGFFFISSIRFLVSSKSFTCSSRSTFSITCTCWRL